MLSSFLLGLFTLLVSSLFHTFVSILVLRVVGGILLRGFTVRRIRSNVYVVQIALLLAFLSHLGQIALWAVVLMACGEIQGLSAALYVSTGNYTTVGPGAVVMSEAWRALGPLEAMNGMHSAGEPHPVPFQRRGQRPGRSAPP
jgi:hypothetical protein